jgi:uncharacterized protein DUF4388
MAHLAPDAHLRDEAHVHADTSDALTFGFDIRLPSAQLADLIQINCLNRVRGAFRVSSGSGEGLLFFDGGQLVHAVTADREGLEAMIVMLGWRGGHIEPCRVPWPATGSIQMGADALLLSAAQRMDERARSLQPEATTKVVRRIDLGGPEPARSPARASEPAGVAQRGTPSLECLSRLEVARVATDGNIEGLRAGASTDLADTAFHAQTLASLIGDGLGLGDCRALACSGEHDGMVVFTGRTIVGVRGQLADLAVVRAKVGLE